MALGTPNYVTSSEHNVSAGSGTSVATGSCAPTGSALVLAQVIATRIGGDPGTISISSDTFGAGMGAWTQVGSQALVSGSGFQIRVATFWAYSAASPGSGTVTASWASAGYNYGIWLEEYPTGYHASAPIGATGSHTQSSGTTMAVTLSGTPASTSSAHGFLVNAGLGSITAGSGFTTLRVNASGGVETEYDLTPVDAVVDWSDLGGGISVAIAYEILAAAPVLLVVADASHAHAADNLGLTQQNTLVVAETAHAHSVDSVALVQQNVLAVADALHAHAVENLTLETVILLAVADALHAHAADNLDLVQQNTLALQGALHAHDVENLDLVQANVLVVADTLHAHTAESPTPTIAFLLTVADALHAHTADGVALTQQNVLAVADALHAHAADAPTLVQQNILAVADALHAHAADGLTLSVAFLLAVADTAHGHSVDNVALVQQNTLSVADALHAHAVDNVALTQANVLAVQDALHAHSTDNIGLLALITLTVQDASHAHTADTIELGLIILSLGGILVPVLQFTPVRRFVDLAPTHRTYGGTIRSGRTSNRGQYQTWDIQTTDMARADAITLRDALLAGVVEAVGTVVGGTVDVLIPPDSIAQTESDSLAYASLRFEMLEDAPA